MHCQILLVLYMFMRNIVIFDGVTADLLRNFKLNPELNRFYIQLISDKKFLTASDQRNFLLAAQDIKAFLMLIKKS